MKNIVEFKESLINLLEDQYSGKNLNDYCKGRAGAFKLVITFLDLFLNVGKNAPTEEGEIKP